MTSREIFDALNANYSGRQGGMAINTLKSNGVQIEEIPDDGTHVFAHYKIFGSDGGYVEEIATSYDHSRTFELRPDSNHFDLTLYNSDGEKVDHACPVIWDKE